MASRANVTVIEHPARDPWDFPPNTKSVTYLGVDYTVP